MSLKMPTGMLGDPVLDINQCENRRTNSFAERARTESRPYPGLQSR
jgi:hypothetical protein